MCEFVRWEWVCALWCVLSSYEYVFLTQCLMSQYACLLPLLIAYARVWVVLLTPSVFASLFMQGIFFLCWVQLHVCAHWVEFDLPMCTLVTNEQIVPLCIHVLSHIHYFGNFKMVVMIVKLASKAVDTSMLDFSIPLLALESHYWFALLCRYYPYLCELSWPKHYQCSNYEL